MILDKFASYFLFCSIPVFFLSLFSRKIFIILTAAIPVAVCAFFYLPFLLDIRVPLTPPAIERFRIATFNIWNHNKNIEALVAVINQGNSDVVAVQEVTDAQKPELISLLSRTYPFYHVSKPVYGGTTALFSRHSLYNITELDFAIDRPAIIADVDWQGERVSVVSAHLNPSFWAYHQQPLRKLPGNFRQYIADQNTQANMIIDALKERSTVAQFLACDCNSQETASTNRIFRSYFKDTFRAVGWYLGSPIDGMLMYEHNLMHIDYVWFAGHATPDAIYRSRESAGSDHQQIIADFYMYQ